MMALFSRLSTGMKMLIILSAALWPLGLIALSVSAESARSNRLNRQAEAQLMAADGATKLNLTLTRATATLRQALPQDDSRQIDPARCAAALDNAQNLLGRDIALALYDVSGRRICSEGAFSALRFTRPFEDVGTEVRLIDAAGLMRFSIGALAGDSVVVGELPAAALARIVRPALATGHYTITLRQGDAAIDVPVPGGEVAAQPDMLTVTEPIAGGQLLLEMAVSGSRIRAIEILMVLLPFLMWLAAAAIGWLVVDRLLLRPLARMQQAIAGWDVHEGPLTLPAMTTPSQEIRALGEAFRSATEKLTVHEAELEAGLARQTKLTREVHHRVKNNLQVVSSLINLHARGAHGDDVRAAYASIQRRVDALAVVHRNHYAELEENRGLGLRPLISEMASNLRATASPDAANLSITLELMPAFASQDVAVPIAFLITELVEMVMLCDPSGGVVIRLRPGTRPDRAELSITAPGLASDACGQHPAIERFTRVIEGLSRQLRAPIRRDDDDAGYYAIEISIAPDIAAS